MIIFIFSILSFPIHRTNDSNTLTKSSQFNIYPSQDLVNIITIHPVFLETKTIKKLKTRRVEIYDSAF